MSDSNDEQNIPDARDGGDAALPSSASDEPAAATEDERVAADALARALDPGDAGSDPAPGTAAATVHALRAGRGQLVVLDPARKAAMVARAVASARRARRRRTVRTAFISFAAAAAVLFAVGRLGIGASEGPGADAGPGTRLSGRVVVYGGASDAVFGEPFPDDQRASERLDRLTSARTRDYFAALGAAGGGDR